MDISQLSIPVSLTVAKTAILPLATHRMAESEKRLERRRYKRRHLYFTGEVTNSTPLQIMNV